MVRSDAELRNVAVWITHGRIFIFRFSLFTAVVRWSLGHSQSESGWASADPVASVQTSVFVRTHMVRARLLGNDSSYIIGHAHSHIWGPGYNGFSATTWLCELSSRRDWIPCLGKIHVDCRDCTKPAFSFQIWLEIWASFTLVFLT